MSCKIFKAVKINIFILWVKQCGYKASQKIAGPIFLFLY